MRTRVYYSTDECNFRECVTMIFYVTYCIYPFSGHSHLNFASDRRRWCLDRMRGSIPHLPCSSDNVATSWRPRMTIMNTEAVNECEKTYQHCPRRTPGRGKGECSLGWVNTGGGENTNWVLTLFIVGSVANELMERRETDRKPLTYWNHCLSTNWKRCWTPRFLSPFHVYISM